MNSIGIFCIFAAYLIGAIPFGVLLSRGSGIDIRSQGSGNIGATNVARLLGKKLGALTLLLDVAKGFLPICCAALLLGEDMPHRGLTLACVGAAGVLGHMFPVYLRFKGGKGVATALGLFLYLSPWATLLALAAFLATLKFSGFVSAGSLIAAATLPIFLWILGGAAWQIGLSAFVALLIWIKHQTNIVRLIHGTESSWKDKKQDKKS